MGDVVKATKTDRGMIVHELADGGTRRYLAVRGGIAWPLLDANLPAYFCIFGEEQTPETRFDRTRGRLCFLCEYEAESFSLSSFFARLTDAATLYNCDTFYGVTELSRGEDYRGFVEAFREFLYEKKAKGQLEEAPWHEHLTIGIHHIQSWREKKLLEIPEDSHIAAQLRSLQQGEQLKTIPETLNAVNAFRFVICGFEKYRPVLSDSNWRERLGRHSGRI